MRRIGIGGNRMIETKVIEKFMEDNCLEPYDAFEMDGDFKRYSPLYFNEDLKLRSMYLDSKNVNASFSDLFLCRLLTEKDNVKHKKAEDNNSEVVAEEKKNLICKVSVKGFVMTDKELGYLRRACNLASHVAFEKGEKEIYRKLNEYLITGERS